MALGKSYIVNGNLIRTKRVNLDKHFIYNHHEPIISQETFDKAIALHELRSIGEAKVYMPMSERITNYANYVYCVENEKYLWYVIERPKGMYEIPTLFCYNKAKKNRIMISVKNLMLLLMDAVNKFKESQQLILNEIGAYLNEHISKTDLSLQDDSDNKIDILTFKTKLLSAKKKFLILQN